MSTITELVFWNERGEVEPGAEGLDRPCDRLLGAHRLDLGGDPLGIDELPPIVGSGRWPLPFPFVGATRRAGAGG